MPSFTLTTKIPFAANGEIIQPGLSVQISTPFPNPFNDVEKINQAFIRVHGIDLKAGGQLGSPFLDYYQN